MSKKYAKFVAIIFAALFFVLGMLTLPHYGINWDTINHLPRGQAYLHYFLTGEKDYSSLPVYKLHWQDPNTLTIKTTLDAIENFRSLYQNNSVTFDSILGWDGGHPPLSDILSSIFNRVLFGKLHLINDIDSYRVYGVLLAAGLIGLVFYWSWETSGFWGGLISAISLFLYPLFWSESHFNTQKDIPETVFWSFFVFAVYRGFTKNSWRWILFSALFCGLALGTKFNILFSVFVLIPWIIVYVLTNRQKKNLSLLTNLKKYTKVWITLLFVPVIAFAILVLTWPYLWQDIISGLSKIIGFYEGIGVSKTVGGMSRLLRFNLYPIKWIVFTTPVITLIFLIFGIAAVIFKAKKDKQKLGLLFLLWFIVPIARVTLGGTVIYGGIRQIMEYIPAVALLAGVSAGWLIKFCSQRIKLRPYIFGVIVILAFIPITVKLYKVHPNENVYFNFLIGGLNGAKNNKIPGWGNSFGAAYRQGIIWINKNAEPNAKLVFAFELMPNIPNSWVRPDILFHNTKRSGFLRSGEYAITLTYEGTAERSYYDRYLENVLEPVYEVKVDGVAILKVWKNDSEHSRDQYKTLALINGVKWRRLIGELEADLGKEVSLSYLDISFRSNNYCKELDSGSVSLSSDGNNWKPMNDLLPPEQISILGKEPSEDRMVFSFLGDKAKFIKIKYSPIDTCLKNFVGGKVYMLPSKPLTSLYTFL